MPARNPGPYVQLQRLKDEVARLKERIKTLEGQIYDLGGEPLP